MSQSFTADDIVAAAEKIKAAGQSAPRLARDPVNQPMINNWVEAIGDTNPIYVDVEAARAAGHPDVVAPPAMAQVWTMLGLNGVRPADDPMNATNDLLDAAGYTSVVGTNCEQIYHRYLRVGEQVNVRSSLDSLVGPKRTGLGEGWFATYRTSWYVGDELVTEMLFRILKFAPGAAKPAPTEDLAKRVRPTVSMDTEFFWAGTKLGELRIQRRPDGTLQHPPVPALWKDKSEQTDYVVASGRGTVFSFVVHHAPKVPGRALPYVVALVELEEGVRMLGELRGIDPAEVEVGLPVEVGFEALDDDNTVPYWKAVK
ncbi:bifunctional MaoC family dehydratase/OB-fold nucleic acid binding domain-containing protein [Nocardia otitidiscaviarum]|uniref:bifunctional MaoC family dehydratase N-terminal/OB-fold nucleic acid binding domain-containing protein n=1 Tax=Nocardia otitidiscaviarum TaxID=1823 RepID=UPI0004A6B5C3|nr:bifunctional MaoC family dehydratase N-terminal/OB-fold nucleic acid binding domain-containing protein [Nocardia otitidiscaviarum]MBF6134222.1 bifunctional MaoC family dehydratase/OB-fold nucleic acid binding domain-containing protein [Nocardia otitidiscaviarum]MBF6484116.1 bifunctional MaoC family dehydratase/OB-fold nucleic acid binding domain-containing protein [Nocardia otitidiscaviarum]